MLASKVAFEATRNGDGLQGASGWFWLCELVLFLEGGIFCLMFQRVLWSFTFISSSIYIFFHAWVLWFFWRLYLTKAPSGEYLFFSRLLESKSKFAKEKSKGF